MAFPSVSTVSTASSAVRFSALLVSSLVLFACAEKDQTAPPAPYFDPVPATTSLKIITLSGSAEYGASVFITGGSEDLTVKADPFTARFLVELTLNTTPAGGSSEVVNTIVAVATDSDGNKSKPTAVTITYTEPQPDLIHLQALQNTISSDDGALVLTATIKDHEDISLAGYDITFTLTGMTTNPADIVVTTDTNGTATATFNGLTEAAALSVTASTTVGLADSVAVRVMAGVPATIVSFEPTLGGTNVAITAGEEVSYDYAVSDAQGNAVVFPLTVTINNPDAVLWDDALSGNGKIVGLTRAGEYDVRAVLGASEDKSFTITVTEDTSNLFVSLIPAVASIATGDGLYLKSIVRDSYGNILVGAKFDYSVDSAPCDINNTLANCFTPSTAGTLGEAVTISSATVDATVTFTQVGVFSLTATYTDMVSSISYTDTKFVSVSPVIDVIPPVVSIDKVYRNGIAQDCIAAALTTAPCEFIPGQDFIIFDVKISDDTAISEFRYSAFFATNVRTEARSILLPPGTTTHTERFMFNINGTNEDVALVAQGIDASGNISNSPAFTILVRVPPPVLPAGSTHVVSIAATVSNIAGVNIVDAVRTTDGSLIVADNGNDTIIKIDANGLSIVLARLPDSPESMVLDGSDNVYVSLAQGNNAEQAVYKIDTTTGVAAPYIDFGRDVINLGTTASCDPGQGAGAGPGNAGNGAMDPMSLAIAQVSMAHMRVESVPVLTGIANAGLNMLQIQDQSGLSPVPLPENYDVAAVTPGDVFVLRADIAAQYATANTILANGPLSAGPITGLSTLLGPASVGNTVADYADLTFIADNTVTDGGWGFSSAYNTDVTFDSPLSFQDTLFVGDKNQPDIYMMDLSHAAVPGAAAGVTASPSCFDYAFSLGITTGIGSTDGGIAVAYDTAGTALNLYAAENGGADEVVRYDLLSQTEIRVASRAAQNFRRIADLEMLPSGCLVMQAEDNNVNANLRSPGVSTLDVRNPACAGANPTCVFTELLNGLQNRSGLSLDVADVIPSRIDATTTLVHLKARRYGSAENSLVLNTAGAATISETPFSGGDMVTFASASITVTSLPADAETITIADNTYEFDVAGTTVGVTAGNIAIELAATDAADVVAAAIEQAIKESEARILITDNGQASVFELAPTADRTDCF